MASESNKGLRVAVLRNFSRDLQWGHLNVASIVDRIRIFDRDASVDVFAPIDGDSFPLPQKYDLIILTGGPVSLLTRPLPQWALQTLDFVRTCVNDHDTKLVGICWGHIAINLALGGTIGQVDEGQMVGVRSFKLTKEGQSFFSGSGNASREVLRINKFHKRVVKKLAPNFVQLCDGNEAAMATSGRIIGFQGHPEMNKLTANLVIDEDNGDYTGGKSSEEVDDMRRQFATDDHDGVFIFKRIVDWAKSRNAAIHPKL